MKRYLVPLIFLVSKCATAQNNQFKEFFVYGKISKYEIVKIVSDSLNEKEIPIKEVTDDKNGHELIAKYYTTNSNHENPG